LSISLDAINSVARPRGYEWTRENEPQSIPALCKTSKGVYIFSDVRIDHVLQASVCLITF